MNRILYLVGLLLLTLSFTVLAQEEVDETLSVSPGARVLIDNMRGKVELIVHEKNEIRVVGTLDEKTEKFIFEQRGNGIHINVETPQERGFSFSSDDGGSDLKIYLPASMDIKVNGVSMDVIANEFNGGLEIRLVSGDVSVNKIKNRLLLKTVSGDIDAKDIEGDVRFETVSGDIMDIRNSSDAATYQSVSGDITSQSDSITEFTAQSVSGDIDAKIGTLRKGKMTTVSGDATLTAALNENARLEASSVSGDLTFKWEGEIHANFNLKSNAGGEITNYLTKDKAIEAEWGPSSNLEFMIGEGSADISATTVSGEITLDKN
ncbi:DUF4097 family beta strand repeat-containing protein [Idiomarina loihiensis]|jgi:DUF4097 and DUF4098 domain-containing protein YvlB|uniref:DUF4097 family beta strand repeat-containing protein n=1 Tax=Idiomarina TaxID=135575 RepID=UPI000C57CE86|nr:MULTISPECIES: DUF4097 family beta strand repeat-containing protein [unclassified Idiomarina]MAA62620.1 hypothetical protein [Idiomarina sp.]HAS22007.1 hypothetical protein [Idiomarina loihiensis]|tara:strand:+ start:65 stop:1024 length:960 start_codon:yes stop_codon:yes gene_type:complete